MKLYLMRHGETLFNTQKRVQGWCDSPLTENESVRQNKLSSTLRRKVFPLMLSIHLRKREQLTRQRLWRLSTL